MVVLIALAVTAATSSLTQGPAAPTAFDGKYVGTATITRGVSCSAITSVDMTITGGQVVIHEILSDGGAQTYRGSVNPAGEVSASRRSKALSTDVGQSTFTVSGAIHDKVFTGQRVHGRRGCQHSIEMVKG
jgi:hypothetical protein